MPPNQWLCMHLVWSIKIKWLYSVVDSSSSSVVVVVVFSFFFSLLHVMLLKSRCFALLSKVWLTGCLWGNFCVQFQEFKIFTYGIQTRGGVAFRFAHIVLVFFFPPFVRFSFFSFRFVFLWIRFVLLHCFCLHTRKNEERERDKNVHIQGDVERERSAHNIVPMAMSPKHTVRHSRERVCFKPWLWLHSPNAHL